MAVLLRVVVMEGAMAAVLFSSAGRLDLPWFWVLLGVHGSMLWAGMRRIDADLFEERLRPGPGGRSRQIRLLAAPMILGHLLVAGMDVGRFDWSGPIPLGVRLVALAAYTAAVGLSVWSMVANRFFSPVVRIQAERGHHVISTGPYGYLRHPGYAGLMVGGLTGGVVLGSWWSLVPMVPLAVLFLWRTSMEDRFLIEGLEGYADYTSRVRYRLLPGLW